VAVMYAGRIVETAPTGLVFERPQHPYTVGLLGALPTAVDARARLTPIEGTVPAPGDMPPGCRFEPRCPFAVERCAREAPPLAALGAGQSAACWLAPIEPVSA